MNKSGKLVAGCLVGILMAHFYFQGVYKKLSHKRKLVRTENAELKTRFRDLSERFQPGRDPLAMLRDKVDLSRTTVEDAERRLSSVEEGIPSEHDMSTLLKQMTDEFEDYHIEFISLVPDEMQFTEEGYGILPIRLQFKSTYEDLIQYMTDLKEKSGFLKPYRLEIMVESEESAKPTVVLNLTALISRIVRPSLSSEESNRSFAPPQSTSPDSSPVASGRAFQASRRPYETALPGDHKLGMVIYRGGERVAIIDGQVVKKGGALEGKQVSAIDSDGVRFTDEAGRQYYLGLNQ